MIQTPHRLPDLANASMLAFFAAVTLTAEKPHLLATLAYLLLTFIYLRKAILSEPPLEVRIHDQDGFRAFIDEDPVNRYLDPSEQREEWRGWIRRSS